ncbi:TPA: DUF551 domain-containing protein [Acinetobacter baumannii]
MEWISVDERLPEFQEETSILCLLKDQQKGFWYPRPYALLIEVGWWIPQKEIFVCDGVEDAKHIISHWMPLPEPPKN